jgi:hypothetical protein
MQQHHIFGLAALGIISGMFSPFLFFVVQSTTLWYPPFLPLNLQFALMLSSLVLSTVTIMIAGIPAALYERVTNKTETDGTSALIWIGAMALLSYPAVERMVTQGGLF